MEEEMKGGRKGRRDRVEERRRGREREGRRKEWRKEGGNE